MPCQVIELPDGGTMIACGRRQPRPKCYLCGKPAPYLCDYILQFDLNNPICDRPLCEQHRVKRCLNIDYCPDHAALADSINDNSEAIA